MQGSRSLSGKFLDLVVCLSNWLEAPLPVSVKKMRLTKFMLYISDDFDETHLCSLTGRVSVLCNMFFFFVVFFLKSSKGELRSFDKDDYSAAARSAALLTFYAKGVCSFFFMTDVSFG